MRFKFGRLAAYLTHYDQGDREGKHEFRIAQGYAMGAPSVIHSIAWCAAGSITRTGVRGSAVIVNSDIVLGNIPETQKVID